MQADNAESLDQEHLRAWWDTTYDYLFAETETVPADSVGGYHEVEPRSPAQPGPHHVQLYGGYAAPGPTGWFLTKESSHGGRTRFIARVRGRLMRLVKFAGQSDEGPLRELECVFRLQIAFIVRYPEVPQRMLASVLPGSDARLKRRVQSVIALYVLRLTRIIDRARRAGCIKTEVIPHEAAMRFVRMIQGLALRVQPDRPESFIRSATREFAAYRAELTVASQ